MPEYRFYKIDPKGHVAGPATLVVCADDFSAVQQARTLLDGLDIEVWQGKRVVSYLVPDSSKDGRKKGADGSVPSPVASRPHGN